MSTTHKKRRPSARAREAQAPAQGRRRFGARKGKLSGGIVAVSAAAILAIYAAGRINTSAASEPPLAQVPEDGATTARIAAPAAPSVERRLVATPVSGAGQPTSTSRTAPTPSPTVSGSSAVVATYKDGTYAGSGTSRHGGMEVAIVVKDGKIASARVTSCSTRYPCSDIDPLIRVTVAKQVVPVNHVSGASDSSKAYNQAITAALLQAKG